MNREDVAVPPYTCPGCGYKMDSATATNGDEKVRPNEGDFSICLSCGGCLVFGKGQRLRPATLAEVETLPADVKRELARVTMAVLTLQRHRRQH